MKNFLLSICLLLLLADARAQFTNILISPTGCTEPSICIDPTNTSRMVAATNCTYSYYSGDGGQTWAPCSNSITAGLWCYDPSIVCDTNGHFYYFHNYFAGGYTPITVQKSFDGGQNWSFENNVPDLYDKEMSFVNPFTNDIYSAYIPYTNTTDVGFSKTSDGAVTWSPVLSVNAQNYSGYQFGAAPSVGLTPGEVYVMWANNSGIYFQKSNDNGDSWQTSDLNVSAFFSSLNEYNCMPSISTDLTTGIYSGTIYICWWEIDPYGTDTDIYLARSNDNGDNWSVAPVLSDQYINQKWPQITIDQTTGNIYIIYYEENDQLTHDIKLAFSFNGGSSFYHTQISETPATVTNWYHHYIGNSAHAGVIRPAWTTNDSLFTALISEEELYVLVSGHQPEISSELNVFPNPTEGMVLINSAPDGELLIMNSVGEVIRTETISGNQTRIDIADQPAGLYLVSLQTGAGTFTRKIIRQ